MRLTRVWKGLTAGLLWSAPVRAWDSGAPQQLGDFEEIAGADKDVDLGQLLRQLRAIALRHTSGNYEAASRSIALQLRSIKYGDDRLPLGRLNKGAGVYDQYLRASWVRGDFITGFSQH